MSLHFLPLHCRFSSLQALHFPASRFLSPLPSSFSCNSFDFHFVHFQSLLFPCISPLAHCFASLACATSPASSGMMLAVLGVLSSFRHHPKILVFWRCGEMLQKSPKPIRESFAAYKGGCSCSAHGPRMVGGMGRTALYLKVSPAGLACGPIMSGGRFTR